MLEETLKRYPVKVYYIILQNNLGREIIQRANYYFPICLKNFL